MGKRFIEFCDDGLQFIELGKQRLGRAVLWVFPKPFVGKFLKIWTSISFANFIARLENPNFQKLDILANFKQTVSL